MTIRPPTLKAYLFSKYKQYLSINGITMLEGEKYNWQIIPKYADNTGPISLLLRVPKGKESMDSVQFYWKIEEGGLLSINGIHFKINLLDDVEKLVEMNCKAMEVDVWPLYSK